MKKTALPLHFDELSAIAHDFLSLCVTAAHTAEEKTLPQTPSQQGQQHGESVTGILHPFRFGLRLFRVGDSETWTWNWNLKSSVLVLHLDQT